MSVPVATATIPSTNTSAPTTTFDQIIAVLVVTSATTQGATIIQTE